MNFIKSLIIFLLLPLQGLSQSQAEEYFDLISKAEDKIIVADLDSSLFFYEKAFSKFNSPFVRELFQATIVSSYLENKTLFYEYLKKCLVKGCTNLDLEIFNKRFAKDSIYLSILNDGSYEKIYLKSIDTNVYNYFNQIDIDDQVKTKEAICLNNVLDSKTRDYLSLRNRYISGVKTIGWPSENIIGIGNLVLGGFFKDSSDIPQNFKGYLISYKYNEVCMKKLAIFSNPNWNRGCRFQNSRKGNGFLWHHLESMDSTLINFIFIGMNSLKIHPLFVAQAVERSYDPNFDFLLGMGSVHYSENLKYNPKKKYKLPASEAEKFDKQRVKYFIRSLKKEKQLIISLIQLETKRKNDEIDWKFYKKQIELIQYFTNWNVG